MASAIFFLDSQGKPLLSRNYKGDVPMSVVELFPTLLQDDTNLNGMPCFTHEGINYLYITYNNIYLLALSKDNSDAMSILLFLHHVVDVLTSQFNALEEESIRDNFVVIYELLDEMMDFGLPQVTDKKLLQEFITQESHELKSPSASVSSVMTAAVSWRPEGIFYKKNELFLDVVESLSILMNHDGTVIRGEISGVVNINAFLSGMPVLKLGLNDAGIKKQASSSRPVAEPINGHHRRRLVTTSGTATGGGRGLSNRAVQLEDVKFHQCVQLDQFEKDRTIVFIPPDGKFELMSYRVTKFDKQRPLILVSSNIQVKSRSRILVSAKVKSQYKKRSSATFVEILIPVPPDASSPRFKTKHGSVVYAPEKGAIIWKLKNLAGGLEHTMLAELQLPSVQDDEEDPYPTYYRESMDNMHLNYQSRPVSVRFEIPYLVVSKLQVRYLKVEEPKLKYQSLPWVRYMTKSGDEYAIRQSVSYTSTAAAADTENKSTPTPS